MLGAALIGMGSPGAGGGLLGDSPARVNFAHLYLASFSFSPPMHLSVCLGVLTYVTFYLRLFCLLHWDSTDGDQHNDVCQHVRIRHKMWLRLVGLWRGDACNRYIIRMQTLAHTYTHTRARAHTHAHTIQQILRSTCPIIDTPTHPLTFITISRYSAGCWGSEFCIHSELSASIMVLQETCNEVDPRPKNIRGRKREGERKRKRE